MFKLKFVCRYLEEVSLNEQRQTREEGGSKIEIFSKHTFLMDPNTIHRF